MDNTPPSTNDVGRLPEDQELKLSALRVALIEGEESGSATEFEFDEFIAGKLEAAATR